MTSYRLTLDENKSVVLAPEKATVNALFALIKARLNIPRKTAGSSSAKRIFSSGRNCRPKSDERTTLLPLQITLLEIPRGPSTFRCL